MKGMILDELAARTGRWEGRRTVLAIVDPLRLVEERTTRVLELWEPPGPAAVRQTVQVEGQPSVEFRIEPAEEGVVLTRQGSDPVALRRTRVFPGGSFTAEEPERQVGAPWGIELSIEEADRRVSLVVGYDSAGKIRQLVLGEVVRNGPLAPSAWRPGRDECLGIWSGEGQRWRGSEPLTTTDSGISLLEEGDVCRLEWRSGAAGESWRGVPIGEAFDFPDEGVTLFFLPCGGWAFFPRRVERGRAVTIEMAWQPAPNVQRRILRSYAPDSSWVQTSFIRETRVREPRGPERSAEQR
ncbi:MAG: hypothetical protein KatS3mg060_1882 [Dehalococcoidia bacterium]|nr:MAG: hypothetical protein KatS3mg060_1882 [Dehalococcoidia bacterium]